VDNTVAAAGNDVPPHEYRYSSLRCARRRCRSCAAASAGRNDENGAAELFNARNAADDTGGGDDDADADADAADGPLRCRRAAVPPNGVAVVDAGKDVSATDLWPYLEISSLKRSPANTSSFGGDDWSCWWEDMFSGDAMAV